ncbi:MAG: DUF2818 family protein [Ectothiorhodospiraceae bacterium]|nr:DUF2818 family protein [Ectothiorhodospiraceae bacterium]
MSVTAGFILLLVAALVAANLPWLTERVLFVLPAPAQGKREWVRLLEWALMYLVIGALAVGIEYRVTGGVYAQEWEFYVTTLCLFLVFALPGFIYHHDLRRLLKKRR